MAYPVSEVVDGCGDGTAAGVVEGHGWIGSGGVCFEPAVEGEHVFYEFRCVALAPSGPVLEALGEEVVVADEGEVKHYTSRTIARVGFLAFYTEDMTSLLHKALPQVHQLESEVKTMAEAPVNLPRRLKTPRAAAIAGILFAVLAGTTQVLVRLSIPSDAKDSGAWLAGQGGTISLALNLVPFAGIAFLWFMGVVRDHLGRLEDQFFSTVFVGSGLLYLGLTFVSAAVAGSLLASYSKGPGSLVDNGVYAFGRMVVFEASNVYALRMSGVFMISLATIWLRTATMSRWLAFFTYALALVLLVSISLSVWFTLVFPVWVLVISVHMLIGDLRKRSASNA
jgi:hypothetical protein